MPPPFARVAVSDVAPCVQTSSYTSLKRQHGASICQLLEFAVRLQLRRRIRSNKVGGVKIQGIWSMLAKNLSPNPMFVEILCLTLLPLQKAPFGLPHLHTTELSAQTWRKVAPLTWLPCIKVTSSKAKI